MYLERCVFGRVSQRGILEGGVRESDWEDMAFTVM